MSVETNIAVLEQKLHTTDTVLERLADSFAKISDISNSLTKILAIHDEKFTNQAKYNNEIDRTIEANAKEHKQTLSEFFIRMETNEYKLLSMVEEIRKDSRERHDEVTKIAAAREKEQNDRITALEQWRYTSMGMISVISAIIGYLMPSILKFFGH
jgi:hypothetical protein